MTSPEREQAEAMLRELLLGDRPDDDPAWQRARAAFPDLDRRAAELRATQRDLDLLPDDAAPVAARVAGTATAADRRLVAASVRSRHPLPPWALLLAALAAIVVLVQLWPQRDEPTGMLGDGEPIVLESVDGRYHLRNLEELHGGARYLVRLTIDGARFASQTFETRDIELPESWHDAISKATSASVQVFAGDVALPAVRVK